MKMSVISHFKNFVLRNFRVFSFIRFTLGSQLEHKAPFGVSVITHTIRHTGRTPLDE
jgi:hypothetical protein